MFELFKKFFSKEKPALEMADVLCHVERSLPAGSWQPHPGSQSNEKLGFPHLRVFVNGDAGVKPMHGWFHAMGVSCVEGSFEKPGKGYFVAIPLDTTSYRLAYNLYAQQHQHVQKTDPSSGRDMPALPPQIHDPVQFIVGQLKSNPGWELNEGKSSSETFTGRPHIRVYVTAGADTQDILKQLDQRGFHLWRDEKGAPQMTPKQSKGYFAAIFLTDGQYAQIQQRLAATQMATPYRPEGRG